MSTVQLLVVCVTVLAAVAVVAYALFRVRGAELGLESLRLGHEALEREARAAGPRPPAGSVLAVHVAGAQTVRGTLEPDGGEGWLVLSDAEVVGPQATRLGGRQWINEAHAAHVQEL
jgi:hypothetical protein